MSADTHLFYPKALTLKFNLCDLIHVFKYSRSVCQVVDKAILWLVSTGEREWPGVHAAPSCALHPGKAPLLILGPCLWKSRQHWIRERGPPGTKRPGNRLETWKHSWKRSQLPGYQAVWPDQMCMWHRQKAIITQDLAFFHMQPFFWQ